MPILDVVAILGPGETLPDGLAGRIAEAAGEIFGPPAGRTWVLVSSLPPGGYAEDGGGPPEGVSPVFVSVLQASPAEGEALAQEARALTLAISKAVGRPAENVHLIYQPAARGRVAFGGRLVPS